MTLRQAALAGQITAEMQAAAAYEDLPAEFIRAGLAAGTIAIPKNRTRSFEHVRAVGQGLKTKINANIGASPYHMDLNEELEKLTVAVKYGADAVMDLSLGSQQIEIRRAVLAASPVMVGTVPLYQTGFELAAARRDITAMTIDDFLKTVERQAAEGVDFMTIHSGITRQSLAAMERQGRALNVVSRGGAMLVAWIRKNVKESPLYEHFDEILDILAAYDVTISLGDGMRPGATVDATDRAQLTELITLGELTERAWAKGVQVMIEGPGHVPLNMVAENMRLEKQLCHGAPFYVLGPLVTDCAAGYDHIAAAIGGTLAAINGADFLCYVTPAEHLRLPSVQDVIEGVVASKIAAHAADVARGNAAALAREQAMANARRRLDWETQIELCLDPYKARAYRESSEIGTDQVCTMCGEFCAIKRINES
ncbi:MAG: Phosphomethylpyrimidine synthase [Deltaproteobacteria bacterium ADurb.Bin510]|nr:MAG: Phosphomethylpyrimidine synthase [Deltaproteobacteria bacterium ADurb.Bin510]